MMTEREVEALMTVTGEVVAYLVFDREPMAETLTRDRIRAVGVQHDFASEEAIDLVIALARFLVRHHGAEVALRRDYLLGHLLSRRGEGPVQ